MVCDTVCTARKLENGMALRNQCAGFSKAPSSQRTVDNGEIVCMHLETIHYPTPAERSHARIVTDSPLSKYYTGMRINAYEVTARIGLLLVCFPKVIRSNLPDGLEPRKGFHEWMPILQLDTVGKRRSFNVFGFYCNCYLRLHIRFAGSSISNRYELPTIAAMGSTQKSVVLVVANDPEGLYAGTINGRRGICQGNNPVL